MKEIKSKKVVKEEVIEAVEPVVESTEAHELVERRMVREAKLKELQSK